MQLRMSRATRLGDGRRLVGAAALAFAAVSLLAMAPVVVADGKRIKDPRGDVVDPGAGDPANYDIVKAKHSHKKKNENKLKHKVKVRGNAGYGDHSTPTSGIQVEFDTAAGNPGDCNGNSRDPLGRAEYIASTGGDGSLFDCTGSGIPEAESIKVKQTGRRALMFIFKDKKIGSPREYSWFASTGTGLVTADFAPNANGDGEPSYQQHRLGGGKRWKACGDAVEQGAGAYNVRARSVGCAKARRIADRFTRGEQRFNGWRCKTTHVDDRPEAESAKGKCVKRKKNKKGKKRKKVVKFDYGA